MNKQLLTEYIQLSYDQNLIKEAIEKNKPVRVKAILQRADAKNQNGRIYPRDVLEKQISEYINEYVKNRRALGELDHRQEATINLGNVCLNIIEIAWQGDEVIGVIEVLDTPSGKILKELLRAGISVGVSSRGLGSVTPIDKDTVRVDPDYSLICWDAVSIPSVQGAFLHEGLNKDNTKTDYLNELIYDFLAEVRK